MTTAIPPLTEAEKLEFGEAPFDQISNNNSAGIVVASYNIRYAVGRFLISGGLLRKAGLIGPAGRSEKVMAHIREAAQAFSDGTLLPRPDIIGVQEADKETGRAGGHHVARELAHFLKMNWVHAPAGIPRGIPPQPRQWWLDFEEPIALHDPGDTGVALLSNRKLENVKRLDLPWKECAWRPRLAIAATIPIGSKQLRLINAHVDPHAALGGQLEQVEVLLAEAEEFDGPTMIMGDFNTLTNRKVKQTRTFMEVRGYSTPFRSGIPTWRGAGLRLHADWIFQKGLRVSDFGVARPLDVSDHWPIWAKVSIAD